MPISSEMAALYRRDLPKLAQQLDGFDDQQLWAVLPGVTNAAGNLLLHLNGNLREFITPHFVAEELRRRGVPVRHLHSWDDFDRFRKVPAGVPAEWADHIGRPLTAVPDPWECHTSWAEHFKAPLQDALRELEFDHRTGKLSDEDYRALVGPLRRRVADARRALEPRGEGRERVRAAG